MAAVTVTGADKSLIAAMGPFKMEVVRCTSVDDDDTYESKLVTVLAAFSFPVADVGSTNSGVSQACTFSGKTITFRDPLVNTQTLIVIGF